MPTVMIMNHSTKAVVPQVKQVNRTNALSVRSLLYGLMVCLQCTVNKLSLIVLSFRFGHFLNKGYHLAATFVCCTMNERLRAIITFVSIIFRHFLPVTAT